MSPFLILTHVLILQNQNLDNLAIKSELHINVLMENKPFWFTVITDKTD